MFRLMRELSGLQRPDGGVQNMLLQSPPRYLLVENVVGFEESATAQQLRSFLAQQGYAVQEFHLSPMQLGVPYSRPRYFCLANKVPHRNCCRRQSRSQCCSSGQPYLRTCRLSADSRVVECSLPMMGAALSRSQASQGCRLCSHRRSCCSSSRPRSQRTILPSRASSSSHSSPPAAHHRSQTAVIQPESNAMAQAQVVVPDRTLGGLFSTTWWTIQQLRGFRLLHLLASLTARNRRVRPPAFLLTACTRKAANTLASLGQLQGQMLDRIVGQRSQEDAKQGTTAAAVSSQQQLLR
jgi:hypothetical protein